MESSPTLLILKWSRMRALETRVASVEQGQARLEGLVDGLREAIAGRAPAA